MDKEVDRQWGAYSKKYLNVVMLNKDRIRTSFGLFFWLLPPSQGWDKPEVGQNKVRQKFKIVKKKKAGKRRKLRDGVQPNDGHIKLLN